MCPVAFQLNERLKSYFSGSLVNHHMPFLTNKFPLILIMYEIKSQYNIGQEPNSGPIEMDVGCSEKLLDQGLWILHNSRCHYPCWNICVEWKNESYSKVLIMFKSIPLINKIVMRFTVKIMMEWKNNANDNRKGYV